MNEIAKGAVSGEVFTAAEIELLKRKAIFAKIDKLRFANNQDTADLRKSIIRRTFSSNDTKG